MNHQTYTHRGDEHILRLAEEVIASRYQRGCCLTNPGDVKRYLVHKLAMQESEVFSLLLLDSQHRLIAYQELFQGTLDAATVYPREVVKACLQANSGAVILAHNHPSGLPEPSGADRQLTERLREALGLVDIRVLDHIVVGGVDTVSFAERGWL
ncbi:RadC family protein [Gallaecimonas pentaromativorans]|uniref:RadC family protein n=1 Tax=Gallaecimonas pentaromativorans TaxID=584787 RepID=UPI00067F1664|nr:DNA repair protein RadC [Gallaecimonas pentaromativorans]